MRERFLKGKTKKGALMYSILVSYRALVRFISDGIKRLLFPFPCSHVLCGSRAESNIIEGKLRLANHRFVLSDITHQWWNPSLIKGNENFSTGFNSHHFIQNVLTLIGLYWGHKDPVTQYRMSQLPFGPTEKSKKREVGSEAESVLDRVICTKRDCESGF